VLISATSKFYQVFTEVLSLAKNLLSYNGLQYLQNKQLQQEKYVSVLFKWFKKHCKRNRKRFKKVLTYEEN